MIHIASTNANYIMLKCIMFFKNLIKFTLTMINKFCCTVCLIFALNIVNIMVKCYKKKEISISVKYSSHILQFLQACDSWQNITPTLWSMGRFTQQLIIMQQFLWLIAFLPLLRIEWNVMSVRKRHIASFLPYLFTFKTQTQTQVKAFAYPFW